VVLKNIVSTVKLAKTFGLPIVHSTVNVSYGRSKPTAPKLADLLRGKPADRPNHYQRVGGRRRARRGPTQARPMHALDRDVHRLPGARRSEGDYKCDNIQWRRFLTSI